MWFSETQTGERPLAEVPAGVLTLLVVALVLQIGWRAIQPPPATAVKALPPPPPQEQLRVLGLGDRIALAKMLMLWLQAFGNQPGISIPYRGLDYQAVMAWLDTLLALDARGQYPLFSASHLYGEIPDANRQRLMLEFTHRKFLEDPDRRWPAMTHAVFLAKHRLGDLPLALRYARALSDHVSVDSAPFYVREMEAYVMEDMGKVEGARILLGGLLESGAITDPHELMFLKQRLRQLETRKVK